MATIIEGKGRLKSRTLCDGLSGGDMGTINEGDPFVAVSRKCISNPALGRGWLI